MQIGFGIRVSALSSTYQIDVTVDDPTGVYPSSAGPTIFASSAVGGPVIASSNQIGSISTCPIAAWRVTNNSTGGNVTATALQAGVG
jgi:hypothetical protein